jgi:hypothetical protein
MDIDTLHLPALYKLARPDFDDLRAAQQGRKNPRNYQAMVVISDSCLQKPSLMVRNGKSNKTRNQ